MPIRPEMRERYPDDWALIRVRILKREGYKCKFCGVPNYAVGTRKPDGTFVPVGGDAWLDAAGRGLAPDGKAAIYSEAAALRDEFNEAGPERYIVIVLTIAHLYDESPENVDADNLAALCQQCHNRLDAPKRAKRRKAIGDRRRRQRRWF